MQRHRFACGGVELASGAHVILDVAAAHGGARVDIFEFGEDLKRVTADRVGHDVEPAAVAHGKERTRYAVFGSRGEELIEEGNERREAFERETLGAEVALLNDLLEYVGANEAGKDAALVGRLVGPFHPFLNPGTLFG